MIRPTPRGLPAALLDVGRIIDPPLFEMPWSRGISIINKARALFYFWSFP
jgi:hypothetical protein